MRRKCTTHRRDAGLLRQDGSASRCWHAHAVTFSNLGRMLAQSFLRQESTKNKRSFTQNFACWTCPYRQAAKVDRQVALLRLGPSRPMPARSGVHTKGPATATRSASWTPSFTSSELSSCNHLPSCKTVCSPSRRMRTDAANLMSRCSGVLSRTCLLEMTS